MLSAAAAGESQARQAHRDALRVLEAARDAKNAAEKRQSETAARRSALEEAFVRLEGTRVEASEKLQQAKAALGQLNPAAELSARLDTARAAAAQDRAFVAEARAELQSLLRDAESRAKRLASIEEERQSWLARSNRAEGQIAALEERRKEASEELRRLAEAPDVFHSTRQSLIRRIEAAGDARKTAAGARVAGETRLATADRTARGALEAMSAAREDKARNEARVEAARARRNEVAHMIAAEIGCAEAELFGLAQVAPGDELPPVEMVEKKLDGLKGDRERLGGVNLRADEELNEIQASKTNLSTEHADLTEAIRRLRQAIHGLNKEGRERLLSAFGAVQTHFKALFTTLFGGGTAELQLIESDDPLEAGLEILVCPPGKKPQVMTLLSGGEQALAAMSLIFAIFLTNPSPVCVLDEVDAPLDDANVERFCDLLETMRSRTETRFITVTHNPITMARMNRLFGVTMPERGVSQLVSVDLEEAERFRDAG